MATKLTQVAPSVLKKSEPITYPKAATVVAAVTWDAPNRRITRKDAALLQKVAALPDEKFEDRRMPSYVKAEAAELREYAESIKALQRVKLDVESKVPGLTVQLKTELAVVDLNDLGYQHERILEVRMPAKRAESDGTLSFRYGEFSVSIEVKKGQSRESIMQRIEARLERQQERPLDGERGPEAWEFFLHRFRPLTADERKQRHDLNAAQDQKLWR